MSSKRTLLFTPLAEKDLEKIWHYSAEHWSESQADRYVRSIFDAAELLSAGKLFGSDCSYILNGYRKFPVGRHVIFYTFSADDMTVIRILHQRMDVAGHLLTPNSSF